MKAEETEGISTDPFVAADEIINLGEVNHHGLDEVDKIEKTAQGIVEVLNF